MSRFHSMLSRRDFMKILGLGTAGIGAAGALVIGLINRQLTWKNFIDGTKEGLGISANRWNAFEARGSR